MDWMKITLRLASPTLTAWQADTIFGHLCWALAYTEGAGYMEDFLGMYAIGAPLLVISNGFPGDLLPRPLSPARRSAIRPGLAEARLAFRLSKQARHADWLTPAEFEQARRGDLLAPEIRHPYVPRTTMHSQISRVTGTTGAEGSLFALEETALAESLDGIISIYALVDPGFVASLRRCLTYLVATGYGKRKSAGYGAIDSATLETFAGFPALEGENGFVALSNFVPASADPVRGVWNTTVKRGKLGEEYAVGGDPFKRPLLMLTAGSCFYDNHRREYYGRLIADIHSDYPGVVQYGMALPVSVRLAEEGDVSA